MSKTPLTDHYTKRLRNLCDDEFVPIEFARKLERELVAVTEERDELKSKYRTHHDEAERITNEIRRVSSVCRELRQQRDRLAEAAQAVVDRWETPFWKQVEHTGAFIAALRKAVEEVKGGQP